MSNLADKRWEELVVQMFQKRRNEINELELLCDQIKDLVSGGYELSDMEDFVLNIDKNIHIPRWNRYPETNPSMLSLHTVDNKYWVFIKPDFVFAAIWRDRDFYTFMERENGEEWVIEKDVSFWIPITYPTPY